MGYIIESGGVEDQDVSVNLGAVPVTVIVNDPKVEPPSPNLSISNEVADGSFKNELAYSCPLLYITHDV